MLSSIADALWDKNVPFMPILSDGGFHVDVKRAFLAALCYPDEVHDVEWFPLFEAELREQLTAEGPLVWRWGKLYLRDNVVILEAADCAPPSLPPTI